MLHSQRLLYIRIQAKLTLFQLNFSVINATGGKSGKSPLRLLPRPLVSLHGLRLALLSQSHQSQQPILSQGPPYQVLIHGHSLPRIHLMAHPILGPTVLRSLKMLLWLTSLMVPIPLE